MCLKPNSCSRVSKWSELLRCWHASRLLSLLSCRLSSYCWAVNHLLYLWTHSLTCHHVLSSESSVAMAPRAAPRAAHARKVCKLCVNPIINSLQKDMQAQPQTKTPLHMIMSLTIRRSTIIGQCDKDYIQYSGTDVCSGRGRLCLYQALCTKVQSNFSKYINGLCRLLDSSPLNRRLE